MTQKLTIYITVLILFAMNLSAQEIPKDKLEIQVSGSYMRIVDQSEIKHNISLNVVARNIIKDSFVGIGVFFPVSDFDSSFTGQGLDMFFGTYLVTAEDFFIKDLSAGLFGGAGLVLLSYKDAAGDEIINAGVEVLIGFEFRYKDFFINWIVKPIVGIEADNFRVSTYSIGYCF